jgi:hypothetical protein
VGFSQWLGRSISSARAGSSRSWIGNWRANRFPIAANLEFRLNGDGEWWNGQVENVSRSGILFRSNRVLPLHSAIEVRFPLSVMSGGTESGSEASVYCRGRVVRHSSGAEGGHLQAATIREYRIVRGDV